MKWIKNLFHNYLLIEISFTISAYMRSDLKNYRAFKAQIFLKPVFSQKTEP